MSKAKLAVSRRIRSTPYTPRIEALGVSDYSVVNHTVLPKGFGRSVDEDYWHLREHVQLWDVSCQRQIELHGPDAARLAQWMTPRDLRPAAIGDCLYAPLIDTNAGMINDPVILKLAEDKFWFSIADSDVLLWARGLAAGYGHDVAINETDVWPLAVQGPRAEDLMAELFGDAVRGVGFFKFDWLASNHPQLEQHRFLIARSGYSKQGGFEIYLDQPALALPLWDALWHAGGRYHIAPGSPNLIERVEAGLLSYGNEITLQNNPLECGMEKYCQLDGSVDYMGRKALQQIAIEGPAQKICGVLFDGDRCPPCASTWPLFIDGEEIGYITTAIWSPRYNANVALAMVKTECSRPGTELAVKVPEPLFQSLIHKTNTEGGVAEGDSEPRRGKVTLLPFPAPD